MASRTGPAIPPPKGWQAPAVSVFVVGAPRCGSSLLCRAMSATGVLGQPDEYFNLGSMADQHGNPAIDYPACAVIQRHEGTTANGVMAGKIFWLQFLPLRTEIDFDRWFPVQRWIFLRRHDLVGQAVSLAIAQQTKQWNSTYVSQGPPHYSRPLIEKELGTINSGNAGWERYFAERRIDALPLWYEDIDKDLPGALIAVAEFVGGPPLVADVASSAPLASGGTIDVTITKQRTATNLQWRLRYMQGL
jgi:trehalose 2-sulfotransferase